MLFGMAKDEELNPILYRMVLHALSVKP